VFHLKEPGNVTAFINNMRFVGGKHVFSFSTHCTLSEEYFPSVVSKLKKKGCTVIGIADWFGHSWGPIIQPTPYLTDGHPDEIDLKEAEEFGRAMVVRSRRIAAGELSLIPEVPPPPPPDPALDNMKNSSNVINIFKKFMKLEKDKCLYPACRLCMDNCPMDGIDLTVEPPVLAQPCIDCMFCEAICPSGAINVDEYLEEAAREVSRTLRVHGVQSLAEAEAKGRFRRLFPEDKVGWDTPVYMVHNKHPRWIIGKGPT
jgi:ferredoxin